MKNISEMFLAMNPVTQTRHFVALAVLFVFVSLNLGFSQNATSYIWDGGGGNGLWTTNTNWNPDGAPGSLDVVQFANSYGSGGRIISLNGTTQTTSQLTLANTSSSGNLTIQNGTLILNPAGVGVGVTPSAALNWSGTATQDTTIDANVTLQSGANNIYFYTRAGGTSPTLSFGGNISITNNTATTQYLFRFVSGSTAQVVQKTGSVLSDDGTTEATLLIDFQGAGQNVTLNGANTFTLASGKVVSLTGTGGALNLGNNAALGASANLLSAGSTGVTNASDTRSILITGNQTISNGINIQTYSGLNTIGGTNTSGNATYSGTIALNRHASAANNVTYLTAASGGAVLFTGNLTAGTGNGTSGVEKIGSGTTVLSGVNTFAGGTTVTAGTLLINNTSGSGLGTGNVTVNGGTLGGTGSFTGSVVINSGGTLAPGASIQSLASGAVSFSTGSTFAYELDSGVATSVGADLQRVSGNLSLNGTVTLTLTNLSVGSFALNTKFTLINYNGSWNNGLFTFNSSLLADDSTFSFNGQTWQIDYNATSGGSNFSSEFLSSSSFVNLTVVPEPTTWALLVGALGVSAIIRRRRK